MVADEGVVIVDIVGGTTTPGVFAVTVAATTDPGFRLLKVTVGGASEGIICFTPFERVIV